MSICRIRRNSYASLTVLVLFFGGINLLSVGILGEYLGRTYTEVKARPLYIVRDTAGLDERLPDQQHADDLEDKRALGIG